MKHKMNEEDEIDLMYFTNLFRQHPKSERLAKQYQTIIEVLHLKYST